MSVDIFVNFYGWKFCLSKFQLALKINLCLKSLKIGTDSYAAIIF